MKQARVEFEAPRAPGIVPWIFAAVLLAFAVTQSLRAYTTIQQLRALRQAQAEQAAVAAALSRPKAPALAPPYEGSARRMLAERQAVWPAALLALERTVAGVTTVTSLEYSAADDAIRVEGLAPEHAAAVALLEALNAGSSGYGEHELRWFLVRSAAAPGGEPGGAARVLITGRRPTFNPERGSR